MHNIYIDNNWELIHTIPQDPALHIALDKQITTEVGNGLRPPTIRIWEFSTSSVVIGRFQSLNNEVDIEAAELYGVKIVRRISGGGAMFIEPESSITYSLSFPEYFIHNLSFQKSYELLEQWIIKALNNLNIKCWFRPINDIESKFGKIGGSAQARFSGAVLHHATIAYNMNIGKMLKILRIGREKLSDKGIKSAAKRVGSLKNQSNMTRDFIIQKIIDSFSKECASLSSVNIGNETLQFANALSHKKFNTYKWLSLIS
ncbi:MAG: lipoate--protein ligase family protein [Bordetella sp.]|nr:MAG: lipoate--protein ligase family protein [Bordetella sp.]